MSSGEHNPSRRALLGAAVALSFDTPVRQARRLLGMSGEGGAEAAERWTPDQARGDGKWEKVLAAYRAAEAALRECERRTAGAPWAQQDAVEEEYGDRLDALYRALRRLLRVPAPDLPALAVKIELAIDHEVATLNGGEACLETVRRDALRLCSGQVGRMAAVNGDSYE
ncbi:MAG: hypothetical protein QOH47_3104 [Sphingomonadales bacterium]|jgi:hypothetical protein|nr:hypothetical protein [Sphingomonadales bacterium]